MGFVTDAEIKDSAAIEDLRILAEAGVERPVCGTRTNGFGVTGEGAVGQTSGMCDVAAAMSRAGKLIRS